MSARLLWSVLAAAALAAACSGSDSEANTAGRGANTGGRGGLTDADAGDSDGGGPSPDASTPDPFLAPSRCTSGTTRDPNESEGPEMNPGHACIACHVQSNAASGEGDAPVFAFAGTLYPSAHEPDNCVGSRAEGATIIVTDATGKTFEATANHSGNFHVEDDVTFPISAKVAFQGRERTMGEHQTTGDCNSCHTQGGTNGAPGRILLP